MEIVKLYKKDSHKKKRNELKEKFRICLNHINEKDKKEREHIIVCKSLCLVCKLIIQKKWVVNNPEKRKITVRKQYEKQKSAGTLSRNRNRKAYLLYRTKRRKRLIETLANDYVKKLIHQSSGLKYSQIPQTLVEVTKDLLKLKRKIKELKNGNNQC